MLDLGVAFQDVRKSADNSFPLETGFYWCSNTLLGNGYLLSFRNKPYEGHKSDIGGVQFFFATSSGATNGKIYYRSSTDIPIENVSWEEVSLN